MSVRERVFNLLGWLGFLVILPVGLLVFGIGGPIEFLRGALGKFGDVTFLVLYFLGLELLRIVFGSDKIISPMLISIVMTLFLFSLSVPITFTQAVVRVFAEVPFLQNKPLIFLTGIGVIFIGILLSYLKKCAILLQLFILVVLPIAFIVASHYLGWFASLGSIGA